MGKCLSKTRYNREDHPVCLDDFDLLRSIGKGAFGKVRVVRKQEDKRLYALKYTSKRHCVERRAVRNTIFERELLGEIEHALIVNLRYAFQDEEHVFMVLDLMLGGDLKYHLQHTGSFPEDVVRLYAAEMVCALDYLHQRGIVHRDLKPENLLLDGSGHVHLTDFNVAAFLPADGCPLRSFSGTVTYMAPEMILRIGYREAVDWWSLGVVLYELLFGRRPFRGRTSKEVASRIVKSPLQFPPSYSRDVSEECYDFIAKLLRKNPEERLGAGPEGVREIKRHAFFRGTVDWARCERKKLQPIFVPKPEEAHFNTCYEAEDALLDDDALWRRREKGWGRGGREVARKEPKSPEERLIEASFHDFDYRARRLDDRGPFMRSSAALDIEKSRTQSGSILSIQSSLQSQSPDDPLTNSGTDYSVPSDQCRFYHPRQY